MGESGWVEGVDGDLMSVVYFDQLSGACSTRKLVETFFSAVFRPFLFYFVKLVVLFIEVNC